MFSIFKRKKEKKLENNLSEVNSDNYKMQDYYKSDNLVIGNLEQISSEVTPYGPMVNKTTQKYIFEKINENGKTRYREIFTGFILEKFLLDLFLIQMKVVIILIYHMLLI